MISQATEQVYGKPTFLSKTCMSEKLTDVQKKNIIISHAMTHEDQ